MKESKLGSTVDFIQSILLNPPLFSKGGDSEDHQKAPTTSEKSLRNDSKVPRLDNFRRFLAPFRKQGVFRFFSTTQNGAV